MTEETSKAVRGILAKWAASLPNHPYADFGQKATLAHVEERPAYIVRLMTLYDSRGDPKDCRLPFRADAPPAAASDIWSVPSGLEADYIRHETRLTLPVGEPPENCPRCEGQGALRCKTCAGGKTIVCPTCTAPRRKACDACGGLGKVACEHCKGKGNVVSGMSASGRTLETPCQSCAGTGGPPCPKCASDAECKTCSNKRSIACPTCTGTGGTTCGDCEGQRQVLKARSYMVEYQPIFERDIRPDPEAPTELLPGDPPRDVLGGIVYEIETARIDGLKEPLPAESLKTAVDALLQRAEAGKKKFTSEARVIKQKLTVDRIPTYRVVYEFGGKKYACWASALGDKVVAPESPFTELAAEWIRQAQQALTQNGRPKAEELIKKAAALAPSPSLELLKTQIASGPGLKAVVASGGGGLELGVIALATVALAWLNRVSHNLFWPCAAYFAATWGAVKLYDVLIGSRKKGLVSLLGLPVLTAAFFVAFWGADPFSKLDAKEYQGLVAQRFGAALPPALSSEDEDYLKFLIGVYDPMDVDVSAAKAALDVNAKRLAAEKAEAARQDETRRKQAEDELRKKKEAEAFAKAMRPSLRSSKKKKRKGR